MCKIDGSWEAAVLHRELSSVLPRGVGWGLGGRLKREETYIYICKHTYG